MNATPSTFQDRILVVYLPVLFNLFDLKLTQKYESITTFHFVLNRLIFNAKIKGTWVQIQVKQPAVKDFYISKTSNNRP